jgi:molybdopterin/thiamine biosynthesis adenylyltransferase
LADAPEPDEISEPEPEGWADHVAHLRETFINSLVTRGFRLTHDNSSGSCSDAVLTDGRISVLLEDGFPFSAPRVRTEVAGPMSWHREPLGFLCLYTSRDRDGRPWLDVDAFLARIETWFEKNDSGWPDDPPVLDLEAYLHLPVDHRNVLYSRLDSYTDQYVKLREQDEQIHIEDQGRLSKNSTKGFLSGYVTDIGQVSTPPLNWDDLIENLDDADKIRSAIERDRVDVVFVQYQRQDQRGALVVTFPSPNAGPRARKQRATSNSSREPHLALSASLDASVMRLRSGVPAAALEDKHVYVVGAGALGSHTCDGLVRAGIGTLTIRDNQLLTPGNMTRHLVAILGYAGRNKAHVVQSLLSSRPYNRTKIHFDKTALTSPAETIRVLRDCDLVVDATADGSVLAMLEDAAAITGFRFVTACLQNDGRSMRIDVIPPLDGADPIPPTVLRPSSAPEVFEAGCGEPVAPTPPHAVTEAAAMTVRHVVGLLAGTPEAPAGEHRDLG